MWVFISYASQDRKLAEKVHLALLGAEYRTFFDKESLPPGGNYHARIRAAVEQSDIFVFLISPDSISPGSYALTELKYARKKWPHPKGHVLPVVARDVSWEVIPPYLASVTVLKSEGNLAAEVVESLSELQTGTYEGDFSASIKGLMSENLSDRLNTIVALEAIARDSGKYHAEILSALARMVRETAPWRPDVVRTQISDDLQSALTLIGKLPKKDDRGNPYPLKMENVDISGANLENANLEGAVLWGSNLRNVVLSRANLRKADLGGVDFTDASLEMADLEGAFLWVSSIVKPIRPCIFDRTRLAGANFKDAHLEAAILANAIDLTEAQVRQAIINKYTRLPSGMMVSNNT